MKGEENFILFADLKELFLKVKWIIITGALLFGAIGFWQRSQLPINYKIVALFKDGSKSGSIPLNGAFETVLHTIGISKDSAQGYAVITSPLILEPVIEKLGLQASIQVESRWKSRINILKRAWQAEKRKVAVEPLSFEFKDVYYKGGIARSYEISFKSKDTFEIRNNSTKTTKIGYVGESLSFEDITFTLIMVPSNLKILTPYSLAFAALEETLISLQNSLKEQLESFDDRIINLVLNYPHYSKGKRILNTVMEVYQSYLQEENRQITQKQLAYLEQRRDEFCVKMRENLQAHVTYLKENLNQNDILTLNEQLPLLVDRKKKLADNLLTLELKLSRIVNPLNLGLEGEKLYSQRVQLGKEKDELSLALLGKQSFNQEIGSHLERLNNISKEKHKIETGVGNFFAHLISPFRKNNSFISNVEEFGQFLSPGAHQLRKVQQEKRTLISLLKESHPSQLARNFLTERVRLLSLQENVLIKRLFHSETRSDEYRGLDLITVRKLLLEYLHKRDNILCRIRELTFATQQLNRNDAEPSSLVSTFPDPLSQNLVGQIGEIEKKLRQERTWTEKEKERLEKTLKILKEDLARHGEQSISLAQREKERTEDRILSLQLTLLDLVDQEISLIEKQLEERTHEEFKYLHQEKERISEQLIKAAKEMTLVPDAWFREQELQFNADMTQGMLKTLVHLVESKNIESNLIMIGSKALGGAYASLVPKAPHLKLVAFVGTLIGALLSFVGCLIYFFYKGVPLSLRNIEVRGKKVLGSLSRHISLAQGSKDLEVLRHFSLLVQKEKVITLVLGRGGNYSVALAELLQKEGKKVLLLDLDFNKETEEFPGLSHFLKGEVSGPTIQKKEFCDYITMGKAEPFGPELLKNQKFVEFLEEIKNKYNVILLVLKAEAKDSLPKHFFSFSDAIAISLRGESYSMLLPYFLWEYEGKTLAFVS